MTDNARLQPKTDIIITSSVRADNNGEIVVSEAIKKASAIKSGFQNDKRPATSQAGLVASEKCTLIVDINNLKGDIKLTNQTLTGEVTLILDGKNAPKDSILTSYWLAFQTKGQVPQQKQEIIVTNGIQREIIDISDPKKFNENKASFEAALIKLGYNKEVSTNLKPLELNLAQVSQKKQTTRADFS